MIVGFPPTRGTRHRAPLLVPALLGATLVLGACGASLASAPAAAAPPASARAPSAATTATTAVATAATSAATAASTGLAASEVAATAVTTTRHAAIASSASAPPAVPAALPAAAGPTTGVIVPAGAGEPAAPVLAPPAPKPGAPHPAAASTAATAKGAAQAAALPARASLGPLIYIEQTLNNCGPASVAEVLRYWGIMRTQGQVQAVLRADGNPRGMEPYGVPAYARSLGLDALMGVDGDDAVVKALVANGFPVIVSQWVSATDHVGHYRPIEGYDDARGVFIASDPYLGPDHAIGYAEFDQIWQSGDRRFMVLYPPSKQALLRSTLAAAGWGQTAAYQADLAKLQRRVVNQQDRFLAGDTRWRSFGALSIAWDELELGRLDAASAALRQAEGQQANPVLVRWIAQEIARQQP